MSVSDLSASIQNYLKAIWSLQEWSDSTVSTTALAEHTGVRLSTASDAVKRLAEQGFVEHTPYGGAALTPLGRSHAVAMVRRHRLLETFLVRTLDYSWDEVHDEADRLEHAVSDLLVDRIAEHLGHPPRDPHGDPIPAADGSVPHIDAVRLTDVAPHTEVTVERVSDEDPALLQFFTESGIGVGGRLLTRPGAPYSGSIEVTVEEERTVALGRAATDAIWVARPPATG